MGKRLLVSRYTFDASTRTVVIDDNILPERLLLITNVNTNAIIYNFATSGYGFSSRTYDTTTLKTTFVLEQDTTSMADTDPLQIFIEEEHQSFTPAETYTDPVSKIRVSNPENLIDTDFEYGLQSTKWETLELTNNIPTFFSRDGDEAIEITSIQVNSGSDVVQVTTTDPHGLQRGSPIIMQSSGNVAADGGFIVNSVGTTTTFSFKAKTTFTITQNIKETYTQLFPAKIYTGTEFKLNQIGGISTDGAASSTLTVNTVYPTSFTDGSSMALSNSFAKATVDFSTNDVEVANTTVVDISYTSATATGEDDKFSLGGVNPIRHVPEPRQGQGNAYYFVEGTTTVDTVANTITFPSAHGFTNVNGTGNMAQPVTYQCETGTNTVIGGLVNFRTYFCHVIDTTTIALSYSTNSSTAYRINLSGNGTSGGIVKSCFSNATWIYYYYGYSRYYYYLNTNTIANNDVRTAYGYTHPPANRGYITRLNNNTTTGYTEPWGTYEATTWTAISGNNIYDYYYQAYSSGYTYLVRSYYSPNTGSYYAYYSVSNSNDGAWNDIEADDQQTSLWVPNHGLPEGTICTVTATTGTLPGGLSSGASYVANVINSNRLGFTSPGGGQIIFTTAGSTNLVYRVQATLIKDNANTIKITGNTLQDTSAVKYDKNSGTLIGALTDLTTYYVAFKSGDYFKLSTTQYPYSTAYVVANQASAVYVNPSSGYVRFLSDPFVSGDCVQYTSNNPIPGFTNGAIYWVQKSSSTIYYLHNSKADALSNTDPVRAIAYSTGTGTFTKLNIIDITTTPSGETQKLEADYVGAADGLYSVASTAADQQSFTFSAGGKIEARTKSTTCQESFVAEFDALYLPDHGFISGDAVVYTTSGSVNITGLTSTSTYYAVRKNKDFLQFATTEANAILETPSIISLTETAATSVYQTGTITLQPSTIVGSFNGTGTITFTASNTQVTGEDTNFLSYYSKGDTFFINEPGTETTTTISATNTSTDVFTATGHTIVTGDMIKFGGDVTPAGFASTNIYFARNVDANTFSVHLTRTDAVADSNKHFTTDAGTNATVTRYSTSGSIIERTIDYVNSNTQMTFTTALPSTAQTNVNYLQNTSLLLRPDGFALHRPYDGGVELIPSTNPDSTMIRQTRKYFRYQSGKGIQVSFAVNFSPTSMIDSFTRSGTTGTITTRFPHRLSTDLTITTSGSTNTSNDTIGTTNIDITVGAVDGSNKYYIEGELLTTYELKEGRTYRFRQDEASNNGHPIRFSTTEHGTHGGGSEYTTGVTTNGTPGTSGSYTQITVAGSAPSLYTYCTAHTGMGFAVTTVTDSANNKANLWNGDLQVASVTDNFTFTVELPGTPSDAEATGIVEYHVKQWTNSNLKCGLFDDQNGLYFEFDGEKLHCCRRSSIRQISGYANVQFRAGLLTGTNTKWVSQLNAGDMIVIKGQSYKVSKISSNTLMYITPSYRGTTAEKVVITITEDTKTEQSNWSIDPADGTGPSGFVFDKYKIQMAYIDYSWYGAGKVRYGFKDQNGNVKYVHSYAHGNYKTEAYMRSGNVPARYEIENVGQPTYVPALAHWGTSVIMDGRFDSDKAYIFSAPSKNLTLTGISQLSVQAKAEITGEYWVFANSRYRRLGYALLLASASSDLNSVSTGLAIGGADAAANTTSANPSSSLITPNQPYQPSVYARTSQYDWQSGTYRDLLVLNSAPTGTAGSDSTYTIGAASGGEIAVNKDLPVISIRLAPSVDTSAPGFLGEREIINRMQLILDNVNITSTHSCTVKLVLNGELSSNAWERVTNPSLSQLITHENVDTITGGASVFNFEAQGGTGSSARTPVLTTTALGDIATLGNSILGGDNVYPDGPDVLTVVATLNEDPSTVTGSNPFIISGRISWSESQA